MKYSLSSHQPAEYLRQADEIYIKERDSGVVFDLLEEYPNTQIVVENTPILAQNVTIEISSLDRIPDAPWFYKYPATTAYELDALKRAGASQVRVAAPLFFDLKDYGIPLRVFANQPHLGYLPFDGAIGAYIRPEDVPLYEPYIFTIEFANCDLTKEQALFRIYQKQQWRGRIEDIIPGLNAPKAYNPLIPPQFAESRLHCQQRCTVGMSCQACKRYLNLANKELYNELRNNANSND